MPIRSKAQGRLMQAVAHNPAFAKKVGIKQKVGKEFVGMAEGGDVEAPEASGLPRVDEAVKAAELGMTVPEYRASLASSRAKAVAPQSNARFSGRPADNTEQRDALLKRLKARDAAAGFATGGSIDGCAQRGKTRAKRS